MTRTCMIALALLTAACTDRGRKGGGGEPAAVESEVDDPAAASAGGGDRVLDRLERDLTAQAAAVGRDDPGYALAEHRLAAAEIERGHCDRARPRLRHAADVLWRSDEPLAMARVQVDLGECAVRAGDGRDAREQYQRLLSLCREIDCPPALPAIGRAGMAQAAWAGAASDDDRAGAERDLAAARAALAALDADAEAAAALTRLDAWLAVESIRLPR